MKKIMKCRKKDLFTGFLFSIFCILYLGSGNYEKAYAAENQERLRLLFIGNSHTYRYNLPELVADRFREERYDCEVTMIARAKFTLKDHMAEPEVKFNIQYGNYDYVVLQDRAHPFNEDECFSDAVPTLNEWIRAAGAVPVLYMGWARKDEEEKQEYMTEKYKEVAEELEMPLAPVGELWWEYMKENPDIEMYAEDGGHSSKEGSEFAAKVIGDTIKEELEVRVTK